jgi:hypothetical protein
MGLKSRDLVENDGAAERIHNRKQCRKGKQESLNRAGEQHERKDSASFLKKRRPGRRLR